MLRIASLRRVRSSSAPLRIASKFSAIAWAPVVADSAVRRAMSRARSPAVSNDWSSTPEKRVSRSSRSPALPSSVVASCSSEVLRSASAPSVR